MSPDTVLELVVHPETDGSHMLHLNLTTPGNLAAHTFVADAIRRHGAVPSIEFSHSGQYAGTYMTDKNKKAALNQWGPSDNIRPDGMPVKGLSREQIAEIVQACGEEAALARRAGYEMIMVHAGHGWLINQFLSPWFNKRTDEYGGSLENRVRFAWEILESIRAQVGAGFPIELRMSGSELFEGGYDLEGGCRIAAALEDLVDLKQESSTSGRENPHQHGEKLIGNFSIFCHGYCRVIATGERPKSACCAPRPCGGLWPLPGCWPKGKAGSTT